MSIQTRKELTINVRDRYNQASWKAKGKILDEFVATTKYNRKYAIKLLGAKGSEGLNGNFVRKRRGKKQYDEAVRLALITMWNATNQVCSKRLVPFIPDLLAALERFGHMSLPADVRDRLLKISPASVDRLLRSTKKEIRKGLSTTRPGSLLKRQIKVRTFSDWDDAVPGFFEGDLVAHCGDRTDGSFLNTLVLIDIDTSWTEFFPLLRRSGSDVISALELALKILPFPMLGLDTDNGSEFINYGLLDFCKLQEITFTRSRAYKKNDQAHVEERNGSVIRRLVGYDRYEGMEAYTALSELYAVLRLYVNFFQPSLKLLSKTRDGAKVAKKYDKAKTPYQRVLASPHISEEIKNRLREKYNKLDPLELLNRLEKLQDIFWKHAWKAPINNLSDKNILEVDNHSGSEKSGNSQASKTNVQDKEVTAAIRSAQLSAKHYKRSNKPGKTSSPRKWRTKKDPFETVWNKIRLQLEINPELTAISFLVELVKENPSQFNMSMLRTLQRRIAQWRREQLQATQEKMLKQILGSDEEAAKCSSFVV